jgi:hypothetical protein
MISKMVVRPVAARPRVVVPHPVREVHPKHLISGQMTAPRWADIRLTVYVLLHAVQMMIAKSILEQASVLTEVMEIIVNLIPVLTSQDGMM